MKSLIRLISCISCVVFASSTWADEGAIRPNIVLILADDMGYGDPGCFNPESKIETPHLDQLAREGMRFTDAHSPAGICVPSRYGLLTGHYPLRTWTEKGRQAIVDKGWDTFHYGLPTIARDRKEGTETLNLAQLFQQNGYATACFGKWHQGQLRKPNADGVFEDSPSRFGFDYYFGLESGEGPRAWIENYRYVVAPSQKIDVTFESDEPGGPSDANHFSGMAAPNWDSYAILPTLAEKAGDWMTKHVAANEKQPFFLYYPLTSPHRPWVPGQNEKGKSGAGTYGDYVMSTDANVGHLLGTLRRLGLEENN